MGTKGRIRVRRANPDEPKNFKEAYRILYLRYKDNQGKLSRCQDRYNKLVVDLVKMGYAEYDPDGDPGVVMLKVRLNTEAESAGPADPIRDAEQLLADAMSERPNREGYENPSVTYRNVTALFMTRTVFLWFMKRTGIIVVGVVVGYFLIEYLSKWQIPI